MESLAASLSEKIPENERNEFISDAGTLPENAVIALQYWAEGQAAEAQACVEEELQALPDQAEKESLIVRISQALFNRGLNHGKVGDTQRAISDYTALIGLSGARVEHVAVALNNRGFAHGEAGEIQLAIGDFTGVIGLPGVSVEMVATALFNRGNTHGQARDTQLKISDYTAVIELPGAPVEQVSRALLNRGNTYYRAGDTQFAIEDNAAVIALPGAPVEHIAKALFNRGVIRSEAGEMQLAIADYTAVIALPGAPVDQVTKAIFNRGINHLKNGGKEESQSDFELLVRFPEAPVESVVRAYLLLSLLHFRDGRWSEGFQSIETSLETGSKKQPPYREAATGLISVFFSAGLNPEGRRDKVSELLGLYQKHQALPVLGEAVIQHIGNIFRTGEPFPSSDNLESWKSSWEQAAENVPDFRLSIRLLSTSISFLKAGGKDRSILLDLASAERSIAEQAFGLIEEPS